MKNLYLVFFATLFSQMLFGQFGTERFYSNGSKSINLSMQSSSFDGDSVFVPYKHWLLAESNCYRPDLRSVLGQEIRVSSDGLYEFVLTEDESVVIQSVAELDDSWIVWTSVSGDSLVEATVTEIIEDDLFGETESIRTISLQLIDDEMNPLTGVINGYTFRFGSISGLITFPSLLNFPEFVPTPFLEGFQLDLIEEENEQTFTGLTRFDIYDFQPGDQIHFEEGSNFFGETTINQYKHIILSRFDYPDEGMPVDSIVYTIEVQRWTYSGSIGAADPQPADTSIIDIRIEPDSLFDLPTGSSLFYENDISSSSFYWLTSTEFGISKNHYYNGPLFSENSDSGENCFVETIDWGCNAILEVFLEGLGGPYYDCEIPPGQRNWRELLYYNTLAGEWGDPLATDDLKVSSSQFSLYPNPTSDQFWILTETGLRINKVDVYDLQGRLVKSYSPSVNYYYVGDLNQGVYLLLIRLEDDRHSSLSLMVR